ncbi:MAG: hypothetical protein HQL72_09290 [Magnetococcales bacterium]|nr:hypothetical protein [Magnetococcales bacterium]
MPIHKKLSTTFLTAILTLTLTGWYIHYQHQPLPPASHGFGKVMPCMKDMFMV